MAWRKSGRMGKSVAGKPGGRQERLREEGEERERERDREQGEERETQRSIRRTLTHGRRIQFGVKATRARSPWRARPKRAAGVWVMTRMDLTEAARAPRSWRNFNRDH